MIVKELKRLQEKEGLTDKGFAEKLGIHRVSWIRNKRTGIISAETILKAFELFPELQDSILSVIATDNPENAHKPFLGALIAKVVGIIKGIKK